MTNFSENVAALQPSATIAVSSKVRQLIAEGQDVLDLCVGEPDFPTPSFIAEAGVEAIRAGRTRYTPAPGIPELRKAIADDLARLSIRDRPVDPAGVVVTNGAKQALFNACFTLFGPGDRVVVPVPYWTTYPELVSLARAEPLLVHGDPAAGGKLTPDDLRKAGARGAKGIIINSPSNPTGAVYSADELHAIAQWAAENEAWIISDEIYRKINFDGPLASGILDLPDELLQRYVVIDGASKAFSMTGWRIGFSYTAPDVAAKMNALQSQTTSNAATPSQYAALAAYRATETQLQEIEAMRIEFQRRRDLLTSLFRERLPHLPFVEPRGAFYLWIDVTPMMREGESSVTFCERLLSDGGVALVPGAAFGDDRFARMSFAYPEGTLREAVRRLAEFD